VPPRHSLTEQQQRGPATKQLDRPDQLALLALARASIESAVRRRRDDAVESFRPTPPLVEPGAAFVTIHEHGELRGCIGLLRFEIPLWINVREAAAAAALDDPRFRPVDERELPLLELEVSVLEPPVEIPDASHFVAGRHGIVVERGGRRALFLPQVAGEMGWGAEQMLDAVCRKAGLPGDAWRDRGTKLSTFEASYFDAKDPGKAPPTGGASDR
jgi:AmmeMemoRadiSam system protein A